MKPLSILLSALFTVATAESLGLLLLQSLRVQFTRQEQYLYGFVCGSGLLSFLVFFVAAAHLVWPATFVLMGVLAIAACILRKAYVPPSEQFEPLPRVYLLLFCAAMLTYASLYFLNALAPEASADGSAYHLGFVQRYIDQHGFGHIVTSMYANLPLGVEMLFLFAFSLGRHSAAALVHFAFLLALPLMMPDFRTALWTCARGSYGGNHRISQPGVRNRRVFGLHRRRDDVRSVLAVWSFRDLERNRGRCAASADRRTCRFRIYDEADRLRGDSLRVYLRFI